MDQFTGPRLPDPDPAQQCLQDIYDEATENLCDMLPPPRVGTPEARARRDRVAVGKVASLVPAGAAEADLAVHHVAAMAHAKDCLRQAVHHRADLKQAGQLRAQSASMGREARGYMGKLLSLQAARRKREATDKSRSSAALTEQCVLGLMTDALRRLPPPEEPAPPPAAAPAATAPGKRPMAPPPRDYDEWSDEEKHVDLVRWQADRYAIQHTLRVQLIRKLGGLPPNCDFEPPPPEVLEYIIHADSENMRWADGYEPWKPKQPK